MPSNSRLSNGCDSIVSSWMKQRIHSLRCIKAPPFRLKLQLAGSQGGLSKNCIRSALKNVIYCMDMDKILMCKVINEKGVCSRKIGGGILSHLPSGGEIAALDTPCKGGVSEICNCRVGKRHFPRNRDALGKPEARKATCRHHLHVPFIIIRILVDQQSGFIITTTITCYRTTGLHRSTGLEVD